MTWLSLLPNTTYVLPYIHPGHVGLLLPRADLLCHREPGPWDPNGPCGNGPKALVAPQHGPG